MLMLNQSRLKRAGWFAAGQLFVLFACLLPMGAAAEIADAPLAPTQSGLIWNRTGLPAVFPLQVKTPAGQDHFLTLIDEETGVEALAAYIVGGSFFKVLVPPGTFTLQFSFGDTWQGEERLFGSGDKSGSFELHPPLTFKLRGGGTKAGHLVDLTEMQGDQPSKATVKAQSICQVSRTEISPPFEARYPHASRILTDDGTLDQRSYLAEERSPDVGRHPRRERRSVPYYRFEVRSRYCD